MSETADPGPTVFVLFGATGDLARRLVLPSFFRLAQEGLLPREWRLIGNGRRRLSDDEFREHVHGAVSDFGSKPDEDGTWERFAPNLRFAGDGFTVDDPGQLLDVVGEARKEIGEQAQLIHYIGLPPTTFEAYTRALGAHGLAEGSRVVYEKPFGTSRERFRELDAVVHEVLDESQVFRIDHFLGKEAVQELRVTRFANGLFGAAWNREHVAAVQIDVPETLDVADRAEFYDATGAALDMLVTHLFQVAAEVAMEPPGTLGPEDVANARDEVIRCFRPLAREEVVRGQYAGYRDLPEVDDASTTETFVAARLWVDNDRWRDVPFVMRTGKCLAVSRQTVTLVFRDPADGPLRGHVPSHGTALRFDLAGGGALGVEINVKTPGTSLALDSTWATIKLDSLSGGDPLPPYVRLIHDVLTGDRALFTRPDGLEEVWTAAAGALDPPIHGTAPESYEPGSWGPEAAQRLADPVGWVP